MKKNNSLFLLLVVVGLPLVAGAQTVRNYEYYYNRGKELLGQKEYKKALLNFDSAITLKPTSYESYEGRGKAKIGNDDFAGGISDFDSAITYADRTNQLRLFELIEEKLSGKSDIQIISHRMKGLYYANTHVYNEKVYGPSPEFIAANKKKKVFTEQEKLGVFNKAIDLFPDSSRVFIERSNYFTRIKNHKEAVNDANKAIALSPTPWNYFNLAYAMTESGKYSDSKVEDVLNESIKMNPQNAWAYYYRSLFYKDQRAYEEAIKDCDKAISLEQNSIFYSARTEYRRMAITHAY